MPASLDDLMSVLQTFAPALSASAKAQAQVTPDFTSGVLATTTLVNQGFTRVIAVSVVAGAAGWLHDANSVASATSDTRVYPVSATIGYYPVNMIFKKGLVFEPGASQKATIFYAQV